MDKIKEVLTRGVEKIYPSKEALEKVLRSGKKIRLYQGFDPTMPNLHIGHLVGILKLKEFQDLGHEVIFLIGDFTGMIGDPSGKSESRKPLSRQQVLKNSKEYKKQAGAVLNFSGKNPAKILYNSEWLDKLNFAEVAKLASSTTYSQVIERDMFQNRIREGKDLFLNELFYPLMQGYDSVAMNVDLEIGGSDQLFNMMTGRDLMHKLKSKDKFVITTKLLIDAKGEKVGKTTGNALFLNSKPEEMFGGVMSFPDEIIALGFELFTHLTIKNLKGEPMTLKKRLAFEITKLCHGDKAATLAQKTFETTFQKREAPRNMPSFSAKTGDLLVDILCQSDQVSSSSQAKRLIRQGAIEADGIRVEDVNFRLRGTTQAIFKIGKRKFLKINLL